MKNWHISQVTQVFIILAPHQKDKDCKFADKMVKNTDIAQGLFAYQWWPVIAVG